jgi:hypothetical protein
MGEIGHYFGLGDDEPSEELLEPRTRGEWVTSSLWLIATLLVAGLVIVLLDVWSLPAPVDALAAIGIALLAAFAAGATQLCCDRVFGR